MSMTISSSNSKVEFHCCFSTHNYPTMIVIDVRFVKVALAVPAPTIQGHLLMLPPIVPLLHNSRRETSLRSTQRLLENDDWRKTHAGVYELIV